jgi:hypothetical protein
MRGVSALLANVCINAWNMSKYKYQINLGGGGGTNWEGTVSKLRMPGILFHHESKFQKLYLDVFSNQQISPTYLPSQHPISIGSMI